MAAAKKKLAFEGPAAGGAASDAASSVGVQHAASEVSRGFQYIHTYLGLAVLILFGHIRDTFGKLLQMGRYFSSSPTPKVSDVREAEGRPGVWRPPCTLSHTRPLHAPLPLLPLTHAHLPTPPHYCCRCPGLCTPAAGL